MGKESSPGRSGGGGEIEDNFIEEGIELRQEVTLRNPMQNRKEGRWFSRVDKLLTSNDGHVPALNRGWEAIK